MKLHTSLGANPNVVRLFVAAKGLSLDTVEVDLAAGAHKRASYLALNPTGQVPTLELDDGSGISQTVAICEYLEELASDPPLIGNTPEQRAETRMWVRRIDLMIAEPMTLAFKGAEGFVFFKDITRCLPEAAPGLKALVRDNLAWLNDQIAGRDTICPGRFTLADIILFAFVSFGNGYGAQSLSPDLLNLNLWFVAAAERLGDAVPA